MLLCDPHVSYTSGAFHSWPCLAMLESEPKSDHHLQDDLLASPTDCSAPGWGGGDYAGSSYGSAFPGVPNPQMAVGGIAPAQSDELLFQTVAELRIIGDRGNTLCFPKQSIASSSSSAALCQSGGGWYWVGWGGGNAWESSVWMKFWKKPQCVQSGNYPWNQIGGFFFLLFLFIYLFIY